MFATAGVNNTTLHVQVQLGNLPSSSWNSTTSWHQLHLFTHFSVEPHW